MWPGILQRALQHGHHCRLFLERVPCFNNPMSKEQVSFGHISQKPCGFADELSIISTDAAWVAFSAAALTQQSACPSQLMTVWAAALSNFWFFFLLDLCRGLCVLWQGVLRNLHLPGALLRHAEQELKGLRRLPGQPGTRGRGLQLRHLPDAGHAADRQHLRPAIHCSHPRQERYVCCSRRDFLPSLMDMSRVRNGSVPSLYCTSSFAAWLFCEISLVQYDFSFFTENCVLCSDWL